VYIYNSVLMEKLLNCKSLYSSNFSW
jgi:hypothetical protein